MGFFFGGGFEILFFLAFFLILGMILVQMIQGLRTWNKNNHSPRLTVEATVVAKRTQVSRYHHTGGTAGQVHHTSSSTSYYATFQVESGDRMEMAVSGLEYGQLVEGDRGRLSFQGTRFLEFNRMQ